MPDFLEKVRFIKSYSGIGEAGVSLILFSNEGNYNSWTTGGLNLSKIPNVMCRLALKPKDILWLKCNRIFLWNDIESYHALVVKGIKVNVTDFIYDLELEEYILDFAAEKL
jgi:hypothetical protein